MALFMSPFASLGAARPRPRSSAAFGCGRARPSPSRGPVVHRRRSADDASRGALTIARGKKKKGFAELMGGDDADDAVAVKKKGAASESDRCPCGGGAENLPYSRCCKPFHKGEAYPQDCVTLMRSRFTGYAKGEGEYVVKTTHPENPIFKDGAKAESGKVVSTLAEDVRMTSATKLGKTASTWSGSGTSVESWDRRGSMSLRRSGTRSSARFEEGKTGSGSSWTESPELWTREDCARGKAPTSQASKISRKIGHL